MHFQCKALGRQENRRDKMAMFRGGARGRITRHLQFAGVDVVTPLYIDANACPVKDDAVAEQHRREIHFMSNTLMHLLEGPLIKRLIVSDIPMRRPTGPRSVPPSETSRSRRHSSPRGGSASATRLRNSARRPLQLPAREPIFPEIGIILNQGIACDVPGLRWPPAFL